MIVMIVMIVMMMGAGMFGLKIGTNDAAWQMATYAAITTPFIRTLA